MHPAIIWRCEQTAAAIALGDIDGSLGSTDTAGDEVTTSRGHFWWDVLLLMGCPQAQVRPGLLNLNMCVGAGCMWSQS